MPRQIEVRLMDDDSVITHFKTRERKTVEATAKAIKFLADWISKAHNRIEVRENGRWVFWSDDRG